MTTFDPIAIEALRETLGITDLAASAAIFKLLQSGEAVSPQSVEKAALAIRKSAQPETALEATTRILRQKYGK